MLEDEISTTTCFFSMAGGLAPYLRISVNCDTNQQKHKTTISGRNTAESKGSHTSQILVTNPTINAYTRYTGDLLTLEMKLQGGMALTIFFATSIG